MVLMPGFQSTRLVTEGALEPFFFLYTDDSIQGNPETCKQSSIMLNYEVKNSEGSLYQKLSNVAFECLQYMSSKADQIPPVNNLAEWIAWKGILDSFVDYLNQFYLMGSDNYLPGLNSEEDIIEYCEQFKVILDQIDQRIEQETGRFFDKLKEELDLEQRA